MIDSDKPRIEELPQEVAFWNAYRTICRSKQIDTIKLYMDLAEEEKQKLTSPGAREDFIELCEAGCFQPILSGIVMLLRYAPHLEAFWTEMVGRPDNHEKTIRTLESAAQTLENLFSVMIDSEQQGKNTELERIGRLPVSRLVSELRLYTRLVNFASSISAETETRSPVELASTDDLSLLEIWVRKFLRRGSALSASSSVGILVRSAR